MRRALSVDCCPLSGVALPLSVNPTSWSFPPYSLTLIKLCKSHLGNSSKLKLVFFLVARQKLSKLIFTLTPASVDHWVLSVNPTSWSFPPSHLGNSSKLDCARFGVGCLLTFNYQGDGGEQFDKNIGGCPQKSVILLG